MDQILIDIGSSSAKVYLYSNQVLKLIKTQSIDLRNGFDPESGLSADNLTTLINLIKSTQQDNPNSKIYLYGTAIFRKMSSDTLEKTKSQIKSETNLELRIISQDEENNYLEYALMGKFKTDQEVLFINIGGGSTELVVVQGDKTLLRQNVDLGVGTVNSQFPNLNQPLSGHPLTDVITEIKSKLPEINFQPKIAFYTGGELNYMQLTKYNLQPNTLFTDPNHPSIITLSDFQAKNSEVFAKIELSELEKLMPDNPNWMLGARACSAFAQAICKKYNIETIIPSNANLVDGIIRKDFE